jgi:hypothetical protein
VEKITGVPQRETVPDPVVRAADEVQLVDIAPEKLQDRMARGHIYPPHQAQAALAGWFRIGNLSRCASLPWWLAAAGQRPAAVRAPADGFPAADVPGSECWSRSAAAEEPDADPPWQITSGSGTSRGLIQSLRH